MVKFAFRDKRCENILKRFLVCRCYGRLGLGGWGGALDFFYVLGTGSQTLHYVSALILGQWFSSGKVSGGGLRWGADFAPSEHSAISGDIFGCHHRWHYWHLVCRDQETARNTLQCTQHIPQQRIIQPQMSLMLRLRRTCPSLLDDKAK